MASLSPFHDLSTRKGPWRSLILLYFLIEKPMSKYIDAIAAAERAQQLFNGAMERVYRGTAAQAR